MTKTQLHLTYGQISGFKGFEREGESLRPVGGSWGMRCSGAGLLWWVGRQGPDLCYGLLPTFPHNAPCWWAAQHWQQSWAEWVCCQQSRESNCCQVSPSCQLGLQPAEEEGGENIGNSRLLIVTCLSSKAWVKKHYLRRIETSSDWGMSLKSSFTGFSR